MIVYGDVPRRADPHAVLDALETSLRSLSQRPLGLERHAALVSALIEAGELAQGLADVDFAARGLDAASPAADAAMALLTRIAEAVHLSWASGFTDVPPLPEAEVAALKACPLPPSIQPRRAEGFAHYALYPEAYAEAAAALPPGPLRVIGLRSIGTALSAMVAAARGAPVPRSLRPTGHPFRRELALDPALAASLLDDPTAHYAVVDEGPGLSGSSFGAAMDFLQARGVGLHRIHLLPGHGGEPGPEAGEAARARWAAVSRHPALFDELPTHLGRWAAERLGLATAPLQEISAGAWRSQRFTTEGEWPPIHPYLERRKFLHRTAQVWLLKFAGLGAHGEAAASRARQLHAAGFTPEPAGLLHGFLAERWMEDSRPLDPNRIDRTALVAHLGRYLGFRAREMPAGPETGASAAALLEMARTNSREALDERAAARLDHWQDQLPALDAAMRRAWTDNRLHPWEWLVLPDGRLLKADAVDHAAAHDLIGCQDIAWDVAGAVAELSFSEEERDALLTALARETGRPVNPALLGFLTPCYLAFQLGLHSMAADAASWNAPEAARARAAAERYAGDLRRVLGTE
ncbi:hypothetical protein [Roseomonas sp. WA12]